MPSQVFANGLYPNDWYKLAALLNVYHPVTAAKNALDLATAADAFDEKRLRTRINYDMLNDATGGMYGKTMGSGAPLGGAPLPGQQAGPAQPNLLGGGGAASGGAGLNGTGPSVANLRAQKIASMAEGLGFPAPAIAGSIGGLYMETNGFDPNAVNSKNPPGVAFGIGQWRGERLERLKQYAQWKGHPIHIGGQDNDFQTQLEFMEQELKGVSPGAPKAYASLMGAQNTAQGVNAWTDDFEMSKADQDARNKGIGYANRYATMGPLGGALPATQPVAGGMPVQGGGTAPNGLAAGGGMPGAAPPTSTAGMPPGQPGMQHDADRTAMPSQNFPSPVGGTSQDAYWRGSVPASPIERYPAGALAISPELRAKATIEQAQQDAYGAAYMLSIEKATERFSASGNNAAKNNWIDTIAAPMLFDPKTGQLKNPLMGEAARRLAIARDADVSGPHKENFQVKQAVTKSLVDTAQRFGMPADLLKLLNQAVGTGDVYDVGHNEKKGWWANKVKEDSGGEEGGGKWPTTAEQAVRQEEEEKLHKEHPDWSLAQVRGQAARNTTSSNVSYLGNLASGEPVYFNKLTRKNEVGGEKPREWDEKRDGMFMKQAPATFMQAAGVLEKAMNIPEGTSIFLSPTEILKGAGEGTKSLQAAMARGRTMGVQEALLPSLEMVAGMISRYEMNPTDVRNSFGMASELWAIARAKELNKDFNENEAKAKATSLQKALGTLEDRRTQILSFAQTAEDNMKIVDELSSKVDRTGIPVINRWLMAGKKKIAGDEDVAALDEAVTTAIWEYAKVTTTVTGGGVTSDSSRQEMEKLLNNSLTPEQIHSVMAVMKRDMANRKDGFSTQYNRLLTGFRSGKPQLEPTESGGGDDDLEKKWRTEE